MYLQNSLVVVTDINRFRLFRILLFLDSFPVNSRCRVIPYVS